MPDIRLAPTIVAVVDSEVIGKTAISVPIEVDASNSSVFNCKVSKQDIEDEIDRRETSYMVSHGKAAPEDYFTVPAQPFRDHMTMAFESGTDNWDTIADRLGWWRVANDRTDDRRPDGQKVRYYVMDSEHIPGEVAKDLAEAMNMEPYEVGL